MIVQDYDYFIKYVEFFVYGSSDNMHIKNILEINRNNFTNYGFNVVYQHITNWYGEFYISDYDFNDYLLREKLYLRRKKLEKISKKIHF